MAKKKMLEVLTNTAEIGLPEGTPELRLQKIIERSNKLLSIPERIAEDKFCHKNWMIPNGPFMFPVNWKDRFVALYYPNAHGGPLLVDLPIYDAEVKACEEKAKVLKQNGYRYLYVSQKMNEEDARMQLEEFH